MTTTKELRVVGTITLAAVLTGCASGTAQTRVSHPHSTNGGMAVGTQSPDHKHFSLPSDGWRRGLPAMASRIEGIFHASVIDGQACAWLGQAASISPMAWPEGWALAISPMRLIDENGDVIASEGQQLALSGGFAGAALSAPCSPAGAQAFSVQGSLHDVTGPGADTRPPQ